MDQRDWETPEQAEARAEEERKDYEAWLALPDEQKEELKQRSNRFSEWLESIGFQKIESCNKTIVSELQVQPLMPIVSLPILQRIPIGFSHDREQPTTNASPTSDKK